MKFVPILFVFIFACPVFGDTILINPSGTGDYPTIQEAVVAAQAAGDTIILANGTFEGPGNRDIDFQGKDLTLRSATGNPDLSIINCEGSQSEPHIGLHIHLGETVVVEGITIRNAHTDTTLQGAVYIEGQESSANLTPFGDIRSVNGGGGHLQLLDSRVIATQGIGLLVLGEGAAAETINCDFLNNSESGAFWSMSSTMIGADSCRFNSNGQSGVVSQPTGLGGIFINCEMIGNGGHGIFAWNYGSCGVRLYDCRIAENVLWGCYARHEANLKQGTIVEHNYEGGVWANHEGSAFAEDSIIRNNLGPGIFAEGNGYCQLTRTQITGNQGIGLYVYNGMGADGFISDCVIADNAGPGIMFAYSPPSQLGGPPPGDIQISGSDIVGNANDAIVLRLNRFENFQVSQSIIAFNGGLDIADISQADFSPKVLDFLERYTPDFKEIYAPTGQVMGVVDLACVDIFGNQSDFSGAFAPFEGINGNFSADPLFCDAAGGNYTLNLESPCLPGNHPDEADCCQIGALGSGCTGPNPHIAEISDIPNDQGRQVHLEWTRSGLDEPGSETPVLGYSVFRKINPVVEMPSDPEVESGISYHKNYPPGDWHFVLEVPAFGEEHYAVVAPTLGDSTKSQGQFFSTFFIRAMTATPTVFFDSAPDSGYSVDNLAPGIPTSIIVQYIPGGVFLDWDDAPEPDFKCYRIYSSSDPDFLPSPEYFVEETTVSQWTDLFSKDFGLFYKITAQDYAGNESGAGSPGDVSGLAGDDFPARTALLGAVPNPFNPTTNLSFVLATPGHVRLKVYDAAGRLVATLVDDSREAGRHEVIWDGRGSSGRMSAAGVYLYRLEAGRFSETRRMVLVK